MALPLNLPPDQMQTRWKAEIDPALANPLLKGRLVMNLELSTGVNVINHLLGRKLTGWVLVGINAGVVVYDSQATNPNPQLTLQLVAPSPVTVSLWLF